MEKAITSCWWKTPSHHRHRHSSHVENSLKSYFDQETPSVGAKFLQLLKCSTIRRIPVQKVVKNSVGKICFLRSQYELCRIAENLMRFFIIFIKRILAHLYKSMRAREREKNLFVQNCKYRMSSSYKKEEKL